MGCSVIFSTQHIIGNWSSIAGEPSATLPHETTRVHKASQHFCTCLHFLHFDCDHVLNSPCTVAKSEVAQLIGPAGFFQIFASFPLMIFVYGCQPIVFRVVNELKDASKTRLNQVFVAALGICSFIYAV